MSRRSTSFCSLSQPAVRRHRYQSTAAVAAYRLTIDSCRRPNRGCGCVVLLTAEVWGSKNSLVIIRKIEIRCQWYRSIADRTLICDMASITGSWWSCVFSLRVWAIDYFSSVSKYHNSAIVLRRLDPPPATPAWRIRLVSAPTVVHRTGHNQGRI